MLAAGVALALLPDRAALAQTQPAAPTDPTAQPGTTGATPAAGEDEETLVARGVAQRRAGQDQAAFATFTEAFERFHTPRAEAQLGLAAQALGRWLDADTHLRAALAAATDAWIVGHRGALESSLGVVAQRIARVEVIGGVPGAELFVNGQPRGTLPLAEPVRAVGGTVAIEVRAAGYVTLVRTITVPGGQFARESIELVPQPSRASTSAGVSASGQSSGATTSRAGPEVRGGPSGQGVDVAPPPRRSRGITPAVFFVGAGLTAVSGALLIWSGATTLAARDAYVRDPTEQGFNDGVALQTRTNVLIITTVVLGVATGAVGLFATDWSFGARRARASARPRVFGSLDPRGGGFVLGVTQAF